MAANPTPGDDDVLLALVQDMIRGCQAHEAALGIEQNTAARMQAALDAVLATRLAAAEAVSAVRAAVKAHTEADRTAVARLTAARLRLLHLFGRKYDARWEEAGFPDGWTRVPRTQDKRYVLVGRLKAYFTAHPAAQSVDLGVTVAAFSAAEADLRAARQALHHSEATQADAEAAADAAMHRLRKRVRGLVGELDLLMPEDDARYFGFGLNIPAQPSAPGGIESLTVTPLKPGSVLCEWTRAARSTGTRLLVQREGIDAAPHSRGTTAALEKTLTGLAPGETLHFQAVPYNPAGDGPPSPVVTLTLPGGA